MEKTLDIVIVGGGIAGMSLACELAGTCNVIVIEQEAHAGYHATGRSAALFSATYGPPAVRALSLASARFLRGGEEGQSYLSPRGLLHLAPEGDLDQLRVFEEVPEVADATVRLSHADIHALCPILDTHWSKAALYEGSASDIDVHGLHQHYIRSAKKKGGALILGTRLTSAVSDGRRWSIETTSGPLAADILVNAAGAWADEVARGAGVLAQGLEPRRRTAIITEAPEGQHIDPWPMVMDLGETFYFRPDAGRILISPADATPSSACDAQPEELDVAIAVNRYEIATNQRVRRVVSRWAGLRTFAPSGSPMIGFDHDVPNFFWLAGQGGYGIQTAPAAARLAAALLLGRTVPPDITDTGLNIDTMEPRASSR